MRVVTVGLLALAMAFPSGVALAEPDQPPAVPPVETPAPPSVAEVLESVAPFGSRYDSVERSLSGLSAYTDELTRVQARYRVWRDVLSPERASFETKAAELTAKVAALQAEAASLQTALDNAKALQVIQEREVGGLARLLYQQPAPELAALEQVMDGENLRAFDNQNLVTSVLTSSTGELERIIASVQFLTTELATKQGEVIKTTSELGRTNQRRDQLAAAEKVVTDSLAAIDSDLKRAADASAEILRAQEEALRKAAEEAAAAASLASAPPVGGAAPTGGGSPAAPTGDFSAALPASIPYRDVFITYGVKYNVEPALLAAIAKQESNFDPWAGCFGGGGKGIMQHEYQSKFCGRDAVPASIEKAAIMLAGYYNRTGSWTAAVFAYNNGPGLMDEWVQYSGNPSQLISVLAAFYNRQSYARSGSYQGYPTWGDWRARVAYSYAAPTPLPGFHSATQKWLQYRLG